MAVSVPAGNQFLATLMIRSLTRTVVKPHRLVPVSDPFITLTVTFLPFSLDYKFVCFPKIYYMIVVHMLVNRHVLFIDHFEQTLDKCQILHYVLPATLLCQRTKALNTVSPICILRQCL